MKKYGRTSMRLCDLDEIKICVDRQYENCHGYSGSKKAIYREAILAVKSILHSANPIDGVTVQEWISVDDRLPEIPEGLAESPEPVLYMMKNTKTIYAGYYGEGDVWRDRYFRQYADSRNGVDSDDVLCWMYQHDLPQPPKGE